jgi:hypothetical protein
MPCNGDIGYQMEQYLKVTKFVFVPRLEELISFGDKIIKVEHMDVFLR